MHMLAFLRSHLQGIAILAVLAAPAAFALSLGPRRRPDSELVAAIICHDHVPASTGGALAPRRRCLAARCMARHDRGRNRDAQGHRLARPPAAIGRPCACLAGALVLAGASDRGCGRPAGGTEKPGRAGRRNALRRVCPAWCAASPWPPLGSISECPREAFCSTVRGKRSRFTCWPVGANHLLVGSFALAGFQLRDGFRYPILAHSVLDFWGRYNVWIHRWLKQHIFEPIGLKRRRPVLGILAVFATSGLLHEYLFLPVDRSVLGWQLAFFLIHGLGAIAGVGIGRVFRRISGRRTPRALAIAATLAFVLLTAPVFIHCLDRVVDLHRGLGAWVLRVIEMTVPT